jgi:capsular exopolysaccharide synthesis family protein
MNQVRSNYLEIATQRDEKQERLATMTTHIEKLTTLVADPEISKVKIAWLPPLPLEISKPKPIMWLPGGFILGLLLGLGLAFAIELLNDLVRSPSDVVKHLRAPLLGMICHVDEDPDVSKADLAHVVRRAPYSIMSECYRQFRANLKHSGRGDNKKVLLITSGAGGDGKTTLAANLATTLVAENCKVLLIDANFRRSMTVALFPRTNGASAEPDWSLSNYLTGQCQADNGLVRSSGIEGLDIIDSGPVPASPAEMLGSAAMQDLLAKCRDIYDYIIIDAPPLLVSDAKTLAAQADGTILVFDAETTHRGAALRALRELREINATVVGTVLMRVKALKGGYFQEIYKSYQKYQRSARLQPVA